jgi:ABC-type transport system involved in cytochrome bd biosynthesis fused ATPase/permease subunit
MTPRVAIQSSAAEQSALVDTARATPIRAVKPVQPSDDASRDASATTQPASLAAHVQAVSLTFQTADGEVEALSNVDLDVAEGDFVSFIGPSGCGKTTLLRESYIDWIAPAFLITLVSLPAASAPAGLSKDGLPVGLQIVAPRFGEPLILSVARLVHRQSGVGWPPV